MVRVGSNGFLAGGGFGFTGNSRPSSPRKVFHLLPMKPGGSVVTFVAERGGDGGEENP